MSEEKKAVRRDKVFCNNTVYVEGSNGKTLKIKKGLAVLMTKAEIKHFGKAVTKDVPDDVVLFERVE